VGGWQRWLEHPQNLWLHRLFFQIHYLVGTVIALYVVLMSVSGSIIVYRDELYPTRTIPTGNLLLTILDKYDIHQDSIGDSTGRLEAV